MIDISCKSICKSFSVENILDNISFTVNQYEKIGLTGKNGSGKTTLFNIIAGKIDSDSGSVFINKNKNIGFLEQFNSSYEEMSIYEVCRTAYKDLIEIEEELNRLAELMNVYSENKQELEILINKYSFLKEDFEKKDGYSYESRIKGVLQGLGFSENDFQLRVSALSGGEQNKLMLGLLLLKKHEILILDEPTNHLDIDSVQWLEKYLSELKATILLISHDRYFLDSIADRIFFIDKGNLSQYKGNYSDFIVKRREQISEQQKIFLKQEKQRQRQKSTSGKKP